MEDKVQDILNRALQEIAEVTNRKVSVLKFSRPPDSAQISVDFGGVPDSGFVDRFATVNFVILGNHQQVDVGMIAFRVKRSVHVGIET